MAFLRFAYATKSRITYPKAWGKVRVASTEAPLSSNLVAQASEILEKKFNPDDYLLTHATIVASVDTYDVPGVKLGSVTEGSFKIKRKYADYRIEPRCDPFINSNFDSWERKVLLKSYPTFIGGQNYCEHVQVLEQSKGRILDAVARDIGDSVYIDILIATALKHRDLVKEIQSGEMSTLSMGCFLAGTQVTMADGRRVAIEDVAPGDMVFTHKGRVREVLNKQHRKGVWSIREIQAVGIPNSISATENHPFFVLRPKRVCACGCGEALSGDKSAVKRMKKRFCTGHLLRLLNPNGTYSIEELQKRKQQLAEINSQGLEEVRADELQVGDYLCFPRAEVAEAPSNVGKARLLGYFLAEGSFLKRKGVPTEVQFNFGSTEKDTYVAEVVSLLQQEFTGNLPWVQDRKDRNTCTVHMSGKEVAAWFFQHGGEYGHRKCLSPDVLAWSVEDQKHLLGAWLSGDGAFGKYHQLVGTTTSYDLACQLHFLASRCGLYARLECNVAGKSTEVRQVVNGGIERTSRDIDTGKLPAFNLVFGQTIAVELHGYTDKAPATAFSKQRHLRAMDDVIVFPITSIVERTHEGWVYDMEVAEDHSYVVEGVAVHNCSIDESTCTQCGHVAIDETEMCSHIRYSKGNQFYDDQGRRHRVAELCGHHSIKKNGGVHFIEASWVGVPAFTGAVLRSIITPEEVTVEKIKRAQAIINNPPKVWTSKTLRGMAKAATLLATTKCAFDFGGGEDEEGGDEEAAPEKGKSEVDMLSALEETAQKAVLQRVRKKLQDALNPPNPPDLSKDSITDKTLVTASQWAADAYRSTIATVTKLASSDVALINSIAEVNSAFGVRVPVEVYRAALRVGSTLQYPDLRQYLLACRRELQKEPTLSESRTLVRLGNLLAQKG